MIVVGSVALFAEKLDWFKVGGRSTLKMDPSTERERG